MSTAAIRKCSSNSTNKRRFSDDQIRSLETTFETESRPELRLKQQLANKLGLQPRQVAIWFQNKRARSKSKQLEGQYSVLKSNYDELASQFEALRKENQTLIIQLQRLTKMVDRRGGGENDSMDYMAFAEINGSNNQLYMPTYSDINRRDSYLEEEDDVLNMIRMVEGPLTSPENGCSFESAATFLDTDNGGPQLWDF